MNPEDLAASRHKEIRQARERIAKAEAMHTASRARLEELRAALGGAEYRDKQALGRTLVDGNAEPESEAAKLKVELEREEERVESLALAVDGCVSRDPQARRREPSRLATAGDAGSRSREAAIRGSDQLGAAREVLIDVATLVSWLDSGDLGEATTGLPLTACSRSSALTARSWPRISTAGRSPSRRSTSGE